MLRKLQFLVGQIQTWDNFGEIFSQSKKPAPQANNFLAHPVEYPTRGRQKCDNFTCRSL
jgi:hypothetical protein